MAVVLRNNSPFSNTNTVCSMQKAQNCSMNFGFRLILEQSSDITNTVMSILRSEGHIG